MNTFIPWPARLLVGAAALIAFTETGYAQNHPASPLVVVELYQSQGCSSCPPAEANLNAIAGQPNVLALSFAVTYWDNLGWKDTFASEAYTDRQYDYAHYQRQNGVYTPQVVVNGQSDLVGTDRAQLDQVIANAAATQAQAGSDGPALSWKNGQLIVGAGKATSPSDVWLVRYDPRTINVAIRAGENGGRTLPHRNVVRELVNLGTWDGSQQTFTIPAAKLPGLSTAALVQIKAGGDILSASKDEGVARDTASR